MGKTVPSYRVALEYEIACWRRFRKALRTQEEREAFNELMDMCRNMAMAGGNATNPVLFEPMIMSILVLRQKRICELEEEFNVILARRAGLHVSRA
jgi:hypothetical protein